MPRTKSSFEGQPGSIEAGVVSLSVTQGVKLVVIAEERIRFLRATFPARYALAASQDSAVRAAAVELDLALEKLERALADASRAAFDAHAQSALLQAAVERQVLGGGPSEDPRQALR